MSIRFAALGTVLFAAVLPGSSARAHDGHDQGAHDHPQRERPAARPVAPAQAPGSVAPRGEARSDAFELVAVARGGDLVLYLDRARTNAAVDHAAVSVRSSEGPLDAVEAEDGTYVLAAPWIGRPGHHPIAVRVLAQDVAETLELEIDVPAPAPALKAGRSIRAAVTAVAAQVRAGLPAPDLALAALAGTAFLAGMAAAALLRGRRGVAALVVLGVALAGTAAFAHGDHDHDEPLRGAALTAAPGASTDRAQRLPDGSVFVPKPTQRLLSLRTGVTERAHHRRSVALPGRIIPDPNASGVVQSTVGGRLSPPESGEFPRLGSRVRKGEVLATVTPPVQAVDVSDMRQTQGELDQQIAITERRVERFRRLAPSGAVAQVQLDDALAELKGLRDRRAALDRIRREPEPLEAPVDGVIAQASAVAGQMAAPGTVVFQIVDPARLWVEALSFDALTPAASASARLADGRSLDLDYRGSGLADRNQAIPVQFAVAGDTAGLRIGQFVTVLAGTDVERSGISLPRAALVRTGNGQDVVYEHVSAERFEARPVRVEALDAERVLVEAGVEVGRRIVVTGAELLDQVR